MEKSQSFVSVVSLVDNSTPQLVATMKTLEAYLSERYSDYEMLLIVQKQARFSQEKNLEAVLASVPSVRWIQLSADAPAEDAWNAGLENAIGDFIVFFTPGTDPVELVGRSVELAKKGHDVVIGTAPTAESLGYRLARPLSDWLLRLADYRLPQNATPFRCLSRRAANATMETGHAHQQLALRIQKTGYPYAEIPYTVLSYRKKTFAQGAYAMLRLLVQNPAFSVEDSKVSVATCTATTQMASIFRICGTAGSSPAIFMSKEGTKPRQVESTDLSTG